MTLIRCSRHSIHSASLFVAAALLAPVASAITTDVSGVTWPTTAEVATTTILDNFSVTDRANSAPFTLTQTFQVDSTFDANSLFVFFGGNASSDFSVGLTVFEVTDVDASSITTSPDPLDILLDTTFLAPPEPDDTIMQIFLDSPLSLPATAGTAGYAVRFTSDDEFRWNRTGSTGGNAYAFGAAYENGSPKSGGRDFALAVSSEAPATLTDVFAVQSGNINTGSTWDTGVAPASGSRYLIGSGFTGTASSTSFAGSELVVQSGGTLDLAVSDVEIDGLTVDAGGTLTESVNGDFAIGNINANPFPALTLNGTANFVASPGADLFVDVDLAGTGDLNFESNGAGSDLFLTATASHQGVIRFNGTGDAVRMNEGETFGALEMNSTGGPGSNRLIYDPSEQLTGGDLIFNQPGEIVHAATLGNRRLHGPSRLTANADVTVDLTTAPVTNERRLLVAGGDFEESLAGSSNITVNGTATDPTSGSITRNEFEVGSSTEPSDGINVDSFSGTLTGNNFVDMEVRHSLPDAAIVVNNNATLETGHQEIFTEFSVALGDVTINNGGTLVVGYEADGNHNPYLLTVTNDGSRDGDLTIASGAKTVMQINGTATEDYDQIVVEGDASIGGELEILVNPDGEQSGFESSNNIFINTYTPTLGDTFDLIFLAPDSALTADFDGNNTVDDLDLAQWEGDFGVNGDSDADSDGDSDLADLLVWQEQFGDSATFSNTLTGTFSSLTVTDPGNVMSGAGLAFQLNVTATAVQLEVVSAAAIAAVPEPATLGMVVLGAVSVFSTRRRDA